MANLNHLGGNTNGALIEVAQSQKSTFSNTLDNLIADATQQTKQILVGDIGGSPTSSDISVSTDDYTGNFLLDLIEDSPSPSVGFNVDIDNTQRFFAVRNQTAQTATVRISSLPSATAAVLSGKLSLIANTGTELIDLLSFNLGATIFDMGVYFPGTPITSELMWKFISTRDFEFAADFGGSFGHVSVNPTGSFTMDLDLNGAAIGTINVSTGGVFTFQATASPSEVIPVSAGDYLELSGPSSVDATVANISVTFRGTRT